MSDITMCTSENCPYIDRCYRVRAKPSKYQSWSNFEYTCNEDSGFEDFISMKHFDESWNPCKMGVSEDKNTDEIRLSFPNKSIWLYSGYTFDYIMEGIGYDENGAFFFLDNDKKKYEIISKCDVLVDGRYIDSQRNPSKKFAGSDNQRIIEIRKSLEQNKIVLHCD